YNNTGWLSPDALEAKLDTNSYVNAIPIGLLNYKYNVMDSNAYVDNLVDTVSNGQFVDVTGRPRTPYFNYSTFLASPIVSEETVFVEDPMKITGRFTTLSSQLLPSSLKKK